MVESIISFPNIFHNWHKNKPKVDESVTTILPILPILLFYLCQSALSSHWLAILFIHPALLSFMSLIYNKGSNGSAK